MKACKEVSTWTNLCENKSINIYSKASATKFKNEKIIEELKTDFLDAIETALKNPLCLANRKDSKEKHLKYLEDVNMNISDLLIYFIISLLIHQTNDALVSKYEHIKHWYYNTMPKNNSLELYVQILDCYKESLEKCADLAGLKENFNLNEVKKSLNEIHISSVDDNIECKIESFKNFIEKKYNFTVPLKLNRNYTEEDIKLDWHAIDQQLNPQAGKTV